MLIVPTTSKAEVGFIVLYPTLLFCVSTNNVAVLLLVGSPNVIVFVPKVMSPSPIDELPVNFATLPDVPLPVIPPDAGALFVIVKFG